MILYILDKGKAVRNTNYLLSALEVACRYYEIIVNGSISMHKSLYSLYWSLLCILFLYAATFCTGGGQR